MKKTKAAFFVAKYGNWDDKLINWLTGRIGYSHVAIIEREYSNGVADIIEAMQGSGIRRRRILMNSKYWVIKEVCYIDSAVPKARELMREQVIYDYFGALRHLNMNFFRVWLPFIKNRKRAYYCSELVAHCLGIVPEDITPNKLFLKMDELKKC